MTLLWKNDWWRDCDHYWLLMIVFRLLLFIDWWWREACDTVSYYSWYSSEVLTVPIPSCRLIWRLLLQCVREGYCEVHSGSYQWERKMRERGRGKYLCCSCTFPWSCCSVVVTFVCILHLWRPAIHCLYCYSIIPPYYILYIYRTLLPWIYRDAFIVIFCCYLFWSGLYTFCYIILQRPHSIIPCCCAILSQYDIDVIHSFGMCVRRVTIVESDCYWFIVSVYDTGEWWSDDGKLLRRACLLMVLLKWKTDDDIYLCGITWYSFCVYSIYYYSEEWWC